MKRIDREALRRAIEEQRQQGGEEQRQIEQKLRDEPFEEAGAFACYACQDRNLKLQPWQWPPCWLRTDAAVKQAMTVPYGDYSGQREAAELVLRLRAVGLSYLEPNPLAAIEAAKAAEARALIEAAKARRAPATAADGRRGAHVRSKQDQEDAPPLEDINAKPVAGRDTVIS
jgi:hypothetical protein